MQILGPDYRIQDQAVKSIFVIESYESLNLMSNPNNSSALLSSTIYVHNFSLAMI